MDQQAFLEHAIEQYGKATYNFAYRLTGNAADASDLTQEAFIRVYRAWQSFKPGTSFLSWIYRIVTNLHRDELRRRKGRYQEEIPEIAVAPIEEYVEGHLSEPVSKALAELTPEQRRDRLARRYRGVQLSGDCSDRRMLGGDRPVAAPSRPRAAPKTRQPLYEVIAMNETHPSTDRIVDYLHGELSAAEDAALHAHLASCRSCEDVRADEVAITEALRAHARAAELEFPPGLATGIRVTAERPRPHSLWEALRAGLRPRPALILPAVAVIAIVLYFGFAGRQGAPVPIAIDPSFYVRITR